MLCSCDAFEGITEFLKKLYAHTIFILSIGGWGALACIFCAIVNVQRCNVPSHQLIDFDERVES